MTTPLKAVAAGGNSAELREWIAGDYLPIALGGTGGVTAAAARANLGLGAAAVAAILGAVSQSAGVPTGAIVQRGSNANGEFVRLADGTQFCTVYVVQASRSIPTSPVSVGTWSFPAAFAAVPYAEVKHVGGSAPYLHTDAEGVVAAGVNAIYMTAFAAGLTTAPTLVMFAIGRWF
ncbi:hypothetical protein [Comamonas sp.]|uniref:hypothetical protein n=1 Tax=Comamonas sp. TaxID=34028 RepID=UPI0028B06D37|nr:hypothetical protein [Comamonas sp.]